MLGCEGWGWEAGAWLGGLLENRLRVYAWSMESVVLGGVAMRGGVEGSYGMGFMKQLQLVTSLHSLLLESRLRSQKSYIRSMSTAAMR